MSFIYKQAKFVSFMSLIFYSPPMGPFVNYVTHLGGRGVAIVLRNVTEGGGGLTEVLCNTKVYILLTLYML